MFGLNSGTKSGLQNKYNVVDKQKTPAQGRGSIMRGGQLYSILSRPGTTNASVGGLGS